MNLRLIFWETTQACNFKCPHCKASAGAFHNPSELTTDEAKRFIRETSSFSKPILVFSGGEPLLRDDIYNLARYASGKGLKAALATNATLIKKDVAHGLKESGIELVSVSIYGATAESHDRFCLEAGAFEKALEGIENLKMIDMPFQINTTITRKNLNELEAIGRFALRQGAVAYHIFFLVPTGRGRYIDKDKIAPWEYEKALNDLYDLQRNLSLHVKATCAPHYYRVLQQRSTADGDRLSFCRQGALGAETKGCLAGQGVCFISYKGEVFGCGYLPIVAGDLREENFRDIWFKSELFKILRDEERLKGKCGVCEFKNTCGGCRARAYAATGDYLKEEPECVYQPLTARS